MPFVCFPGYYSAMAWVDFSVGGMFQNLQALTKKIQATSGTPLGTEDWFSATDEEGQTLQLCKSIARLLRVEAMLSLRWELNFVGQAREGMDFPYLAIMKHCF